MAQSSSANASFLSGPTLYVRGMELSDAEHITAWSASPFPVNLDAAEEQIRGGAAGFAYRLIACRHEDDQPVGSIEYVERFRTGGWITSLYTDPLLGKEGSAIQAELVRLVVPWLLLEHDWMAVRLQTVAGNEIVEQAARSIGMRVAFRLREAAWVDGRWRDVACFEALHPTWVARLGLPEPAKMGEPAAMARAPSPPRRANQPPQRPRNAFAIGGRVYLRPIERADAEAVARTSLAEPETFHVPGRAVRSPAIAWDRYRATGGDAPPTLIPFAVVTLDGDEVIGVVELGWIDWVGRNAVTDTEIVRPEYRNSGYGTEAKHLLLEYAFDRLGLHMISSYVGSYNTRSRDALLKQGYRPAGKMTWDGIKDTEFVDTLVFDLLADEWRAHRDRAVATNL
jgi:RimJ/RimL family protein N-acetyltransferase